MNANADTPRPRGRPPLPKGEARTMLETFKLSEKEANAIRAAARRNHKDKSDWMRTVLLEAAIAA